MLWYGACNYVIINYVCSVFSHQLCFHHVHHHSSDFQFKKAVHLAKHHTSINSAQEGLRLLLWWEDALSGCKSNQANSACLLPWAYVMLIKQPWRLQQLNVWAFLASFSQFACTFASLLSIRGGFNTVAYIFLLLLLLVLHVWWFNKTELSCYFNGLDLPGMFPFLLEHLHLH